MLNKIGYRESFQVNIGFYKRAWSINYKSVYFKLKINLKFRGIVLFVKNFIDKRMAEIN